MLLSFVSAVDLAISRDSSSRSRDCARFYWARQRALRRTAKKPVPFEVKP
jgi:hypothetical protein